METTWDTIVMGAGPAGLSTALMLGRARRRVLVVDTEAPRNAASHAMHGVLGHDGLDPAELRARGRREVEGYGGVVRTGEIVALRPEAGTVTAVLADGTEERARTVVVATGALDALPDVAGFADIWGTSAHTCPYCDGIEHADEPIAYYSPHPVGAHGARMLRQWSGDVVLFTGGGPGPDPAARDELEERGIAVRDEPIEAFESDAGRLHHVRLAGGERIARRALFFFVAVQPRTDVAIAAGCATADAPHGFDGFLAVDAGFETSVDRIYAIGNCSDLQSGVAAVAGDGTRVAVAINMRLIGEDATR
jgi:thioredoxin reductase